MADRIDKKELGIALKEVVKGMPDNAKEILREISFRFRHVKFYEEVRVKVLANIKKIKNGESLSPSEKISLKEFAVIRDLAALAGFFAKLEHLGLMSNHADLQLLHRYAKESHAIVNYLNMRIKLEQRTGTEKAFFQRGSPSPFRQNMMYFEKLTSLLIKQEPAPTKQFKPGDSS